MVALLFIQSYNFRSSRNTNLELYSAQHESLIIISDFNSEVNQSCMKAFYGSFNLSSLIKEPTCYKNPESPSCIDLILTNRLYSFQNSCVIETGLSDFRKVTVTVMKTSYQSQNLELSITETIKIYLMTHFHKRFSRNWQQKVIMQIVVVSRNFYKFALKHRTYLLPVRKNTHEEITCLSSINP